MSEHTPAFYCQLVLEYLKQLNTEKCKYVLNYAKISYADDSCPLQINTYVSCNCIYLHI